VKGKNRLLNAFNLDNVIETMIKYFDVRLEIYKLKLKEQLVHLLSAVIAFVLIISLGLYMLFFFSMSFAYYLNDVLNSKFLGLLIIGGIYMVVCILLLIFKDKIITNRLFRAFFERTIQSDNNVKEKRNDDRE
jgi:hypothetical protein